jgi:hypothetical protein
MATVKTKGEDKRGRFICLADENEKMRKSRPGFDT